MNEDLVYKAGFWQAMAAQSYQQVLMYAEIGDIDDQIWWQEQAAIDHERAWHYLAQLIGADPD